LAAPADYAALEARRSATRLLTLRALEHGIALGETAAVVLVRADRRDLQTLSDLKGKSVYASQRESFDGFWLAWRELRRAGVDPFRDFARLEFLGPDAFRIVGAVFDRTADAAIVRSATLGHAAIAGLVEDGTLRVLNAQRHEGFPYAASTPLYPEWAFARLPHTSDALAHRVTVALLQLPADSPAARASRSTGWTRALDYAPVHELLRELGLSPYAGADWTALPKWARQHWRVSLGVVGMVLALAALVLHSRRLTRRLRASEHKLLEIRAHLESSNAVLQQRSSIDGLTGVANRRVFDETLGAEWARAMRNATSLGVILVDIDFFKKHNDQYGHQAGDECLRIVAQTLCGAVKRSGDLVARYGGEEFAVILPQVDAKGAAAVAERMRARVEQVRLPHVGSVTGRDVTVSLGVAAAVPARGAAPHALVEAADQALYQAKAVGRNQVIVSDNTAAAA
jgi:diguanylate cyclase (GGDEF)-like protein